MTVLRSQRRTHLFTPRQGAPLPDIAFRHICEAILRDELRPGDRLNTQRIAASLDMSLNPIREAIIRLRDIGLVEIAPARFTKVADFTTVESRGTIGYAGVLAGAALRSALPTVLPETRHELASIVDEIAAVHGMNSRTLAVVDFLTRVTDFVEVPRQAAHLIETTLIAQCVLQNNRLTPDERTVELQLAAANAAAQALRSGDPTTAEAAVRDLFRLLS